MRTKLQYNDGTQIGVVVDKIYDVVRYAGRFFTWFEYADLIAEPNGEYREATFTEVLEGSAYEPW